MMPREMLSVSMERRALLGGAWALGLTGALPVSAWAKVAKAAPVARFPSVQALISGHMARKKLPGAVVSVGIGTGAEQRLEFVTGGTVGYDSKRVADADALWRIYSMTKPITGMVAMAMISDGKFKLDQPIADFIPAFGKMRVMTSPETSLAGVPAKNRITIRHLLTHTAGLGYSILKTGPLAAEYERLGLHAFVASRTPLPGQDKLVSAPSLEEFASRLASLPLLAEPGTQWHYSVGLDLLGRVMEIADGKPFDTILSERLFAPLGMTNTFFQVPPGRAGDLATNYFLYAGIPYPADPAATSIFLDPPPFPFGGAGLVSSARDYDRFLAMLIGEGTLDGTSVMPPEAVRAGMSNLLPAGVSTAGTSVNGNGFGAGGRVTLDGPAKGSYGWAGAAGTVAWVDPARTLRSAGFANYMPADTIGFQADVAKAVYMDLA